MNGRKAKQLRRKVYGDMSIKVQRTYMVDPRSGSLRLHPDCLRASYQAAKRGREVVGTGAEEKHVLPYLSTTMEKSIKKRRASKPI
jgi:hypothetical protein